MIKYDSFGTPISFNYSDKSTEYKTGCGFVLSLFFVALITFLYLLNNLTSMAKRKGSTISFSTLDSYLSINDTFTKDDGLRFAFLL
jgi:hypothetical protein